MIAKVLDGLKQEAPGAFGANFIVPLMDPGLARERVAAAAARAKVVDFFYADPDAALVDTAHAQGALCCWQVGSCVEAVAAEQAGCDFIIAQGIEAGGHVRGRISLLALLDQVLASVHVPVLAAGGMGSGRARAAALAAGADGVRVGTRFVAAEEAGAHPVYVRALIGAQAQDTVYTEAFSASWPNAPHRVLRSAVEAAEAFQGELVGEGVDPYTGDRLRIGRFESRSVDTSYSGAIEAMSLWAGESVGSVTRVQPAAEIVRELVDEAERCLRRWC